MTEECHLKQQMGVPEIEPTRKGNKILLVDDEHDITVTFKAILQDAGFIVDVYEDPLIALSNFKQHSYDLVILDIKMPRMNGFELYEEIHKIDNQVWSYFITASEMYYSEARKGREQLYCILDTKRFLRKPVSNTNLLKRVEKIMNGDK
jgi:two-component system, OmpR family, response regulator ChvI